MEGKRTIDTQFFSMQAEAVAKNLLGKFICRKFEDGTVLRWCITETEAYEDTENVTYKSEMFRGAGEWCPYGGMLMINCHTDQDHDNVLIRALDCVKGPCNIVDVLEINKIKNQVEGKDVLDQKQLWLEDWGVTVENHKPKKRVGIVKKKENEKAAKEKKNYQAKAICFPWFEFSDIPEAR